MNQELYSVVFNTPAGWVGLSASMAGLVRVILPQYSQKIAAHLLGADSNRVIQSPDQFKDLIKRLQAYFSGQRVKFPDKLDLSEATPFQREVWQATQKIPYGETRSYGWVAKQVGKTKAARAVGQALGNNPLPVIVPCHRVLASGGGLGGFSGGLERKKYLLNLETIHNKKR
jgi:methylated-DNA-[protein]-cysteine S-methyltransferase